MAKRVIKKTVSKKKTTKKAPIKKKTIKRKKKIKKNDSEFIKLKTNASDEKYNKMGERVRLGEVKWAYYAVDGNFAYHYYLVIN